MLDCLFESDALCGEKLLFTDRLQEELEPARIAITSIGDIDDSGDKDGRRDYFEEFASPIIACFPESTPHSIVEIRFSAY